MKQQAWDWYAREPEAPSAGDPEACSTSAPAPSCGMRQRWGWPPRAGGSRRECAEQGREGRGRRRRARQSRNGRSVNDAARALAQATRVQIDALMDEQRTGRAKDHDKTARRLASYAKTLAAARALLEQEGSQLDDTRAIMTTDPGAASTNCATSLLATLTGLSRKRRLADATASWSEAISRRVLRHLADPLPARAAPAGPRPRARPLDDLAHARRTRRGQDPHRRRMGARHRARRARFRRAAVAAHRARRRDLRRCAQRDGRGAGRHSRRPCARTSARPGRRPCASSNGRTARSRMCSRPKIRIPCAVRNSRPPGRTSSPSGAMWRRPGTCCNSACASARIRARW